LDAVITSKSAALQSSGSSYSSILGSFSSSSSHQQQQPTLSLDDCLKEHTKEEILDAGNEWYCSNCKEHKKAYKIMNFSYHYLPKILILTLKRFEYRDISNLLGSSGGGGFGGNVHREKIDTFVDFPLVGLNLKQYCGLSTSAATEEGDQNKTNNNKPSSSSPTKVSTAPTVSRSRLPSMEENALEEELSRQKKKNEEQEEEQRKQEAAVVQEEEQEEEEENDAIYDLFAICNHYGRMGFGHYTATVKEWPLYEEQPQQQGGGSSGGNWFLYDDNSVTKISEREVKTSSAYILFYRKRNSN
jgi:ubiquitin C-terminal hydrolase